MGLKKTIPYAIIDVRREQPFTKEMELASLFVLAEASREKEPLTSMTLAYYPIRTHRWEDGVLLIDLLGLNHTSIKYGVLPDVETFVKILAAKCEEPDAFMEAMKRGEALVKDFAGRKTIKFQGLIVQPKTEDLSTLLENVSDFDPGDGPMIFEPILKDDDVESIIDSICSLREGLGGDRKPLERAKSSLMDSLDVAMKVLDEEIQNIQERGVKVKAQMKREFEKLKKRSKKILDRDLKRVRDQYRRQVKPFRDERTRLRRRLSRRRKKLERTRAVRGSDEAAEALSKEIKKLEARLGEVYGAIQSLVAQRDAEIDKMRTRYNAEIKAEGEKIKEEERRCREEIQKKKAEKRRLEAEAKAVARRIDKLIQSKESRLRSLYKLCYDIDAETMDIYIPFYLFRYGEKTFSFYPPVAVSHTGGLLSRVKMMFADNLQSKLSMLLTPQADFLGPYLGKAVKALGRSTELSVAYRIHGDDLNLLRSHEAVDKMMVGLVQIRREGWISDSEYIRFQELLVENLRLIYRP